MAPGEVRMPIAWDHRWRIGEMAQQMPPKSDEIDLTILPGNDCCSQPAATAACNLKSFHEHEAGYQRIADVRIAALDI